MIYENGPYRIDVDVERTRAFYKDAAYYDCTCPGCRNFALASKLAPEPVKAFFESFGIDFGKPAEIYASHACDADTLFYGGFYHICGTILEGRDAWIQTGEKSYRLDETYSIDLTEDFSVYFTNDVQLLEEGFPSPVIQLEIFGPLPWVLEEKNEYQ